MSRYHDRVERWFQTMAKRLCGRPWLALLAMLALTLVLAGGLRFIMVDTSNEAYLYPDDPIFVNFEEFRQQFGRDEMIMIVLQPRSDVFDPTFLTALKNLHNDLRDNTPHLDDIFSLVNARDTEGRGDVLLVDEFLKAWPGSEAQRKALKKKAMSNPMYLNRLISKDAKLAVIMLKVDAYVSDGGGDALAGFDAEAAEASQRRRLSDPELSLTVREVEKIVKAHQGDIYTYHYTGMPVTSEAIKAAMMKDVRKFMMLSIVIIAVVLFVLFRRVSGVVLPLFIVALSVLGTMGCMGWLGFNFTTPLTILPSFLISVGVGSSVHIMVIFFQALDGGLARVESIIHALGHSGLAVLMTNVTTAAGLASFTGAEVAPIAHLGMLSCLGVLLSMAYTIVLLPALLKVLPLKAKARRRTTGTATDRFFDWLGVWTTTRPAPIVVVSVVIVCLGFAGSLRLGLTHDPLKWLPEDEPARLATEFINENMSGSSALEVVLDTGRENGLKDPALLATLDRLGREMENEPVANVRVGKVSSIADVVKEIHRALNENRPDMYKIPNNAKLLSQELLLFENSGSDDLEDLVDSRFQIIRMTIAFPYDGCLKLMPLIDEVQARLQKTIDPRIKFHVTGLASLFGRTMTAAVHSAAQSYAIALVVVTLMMVFLIGNIKVGLLSMIPNLAPILLTMGFMGFCDVPLDLFSMLVASIAIGLAVDDTVHFMHNFRRYYGRLGDVTEAVKQTLRTTGRAMTTTTVVLTLGFGVFCLAEMSNYYYFGLLISMTLGLALLADLILSPALMALLYPSSTRAQNGPDGKQPLNTEHA